MKLVVRREREAYFDSHLWLPKTHVSEMQLRASLCYEVLNKEPIIAWREERHHFVVPRNFLLPGAMRQLPFKVYDTRLQNFPKVDIRSKVVLDRQTPSKTVQRDASAALLNAHDGILCLRCGAGKTVVGIHSAAQLKVPVLTMVDNLGLAEQWIEELLDLTDLKEKDIGFIGDGKFDWQKPWTVAVFNSLAGRAAKDNIPPELVQHFGLVLGDEVHIVGAPWINKSVPPFHGRRWGLSATPTRGDQYDSLLRYTMGEVIYTYLEPELIPKVYFKRLNTRLDETDPLVVEATTDKTGEFHHMKLYGHFADVESRTKKIVSEVKQAVANGRQVLVISQSRKFVELLGEKLPGAGVCHGGVKDRKERQRRIRECNPVIVIAKLGKQALNKPQLDTLFVCEPFSDMNVLQQLFGRILRLYGAKQRPVVVLYEDHLIEPLRKMNMKVRRLLSRWPKNMGGRIPFTNVEDRTK
jgi:superfamily II DNA or RNA helicase